MKRLILLFFLCVIPAMPATPTLVTLRRAGHAQVDGSVGNAYKMAWGGATGTGTLSGNFLRFVVAYKNGLTISSITDNQSSSYTCTVKADGGAGSFILASCWTANTAAGINLTTITFSAVTEFSWMGHEYAGVATTSPTDGSCHSIDKASPTPTCDASFTTGTAGDLILADYMDSSTGSQLCTTATANTTAIAAGSGFTLDASQFYCGTGHEHEVQSSAGAINPSFTIASNGNNDLFIAEAFKADSTKGTLPTGMRIISQQMEWTNAGSAATRTFQLVSRGNLSVGISDNKDSNTGGNIITIDTCSPSNTWTKRNPSSSVPAGFKIENASINGTLGCTFHNGNTGSPSFIEFFDIAGADTSPEVGIASTTGTVPGGGVITAAPNITPSAQPGILIVCMPETTGPTLSATTSGTTVFDNTRYTGETDSGRLNDGNGRQHVFYTTTSQISVSWTATDNGSVWDVLAIAFKAAPVGPVPNLSIGGKAIIGGKVVSN